MSRIDFIVLFGKAGAGKDYVFKTICQERSKVLNPIVSDTTRPPREGEVDGVHYNFMDTATFANTKHIETTLYNVADGSTWYYGTPYSAIVEDKINIGVLNVNGIGRIYRNHEEIELHPFLIYAAPKVRLLRQIERISQPNYSEICRRFLADEEDFKQINFPFTRINNNTKWELITSIDIIERYIDDLVKMR